MIKRAKSLVLRMHLTRQELLHRLRVCFIIKINKKLIKRERQQRQLHKLHKLQLKQTQKDMQLKQPELQQKLQLHKWLLKQLQLKNVRRLMKQLA